MSRVSQQELKNGIKCNPPFLACTPSKFWFVSRHGTRLPTTSEINGIISNHERLQRDLISNYNAGRTSLCAADFNLIQNWQFDSNITVENEQFLTTSGWSEFESIARRYAQAFPSLLPSTYSRERFLFRTTHTQRARASIEAFADGVFGHDGHLQIEFEETPSVDHLLRPHNACPLYSQVAANGTEQSAFLDGPEYQQAMVQISEKLGFRGSRQLRQEEIDVIENLCRYEQIWNVEEPSPWCAGFSVANQAVLEYFRDLE
jgi:multiple inositol-polyphosphate phosphatase/2,3-bisphosphoglycerate 3-phosphatase